MFHLKFPSIASKFTDPSSSQSQPQSLRHFKIFNRLIAPTLHDSLKFLLKDSCLEEKNSINFLQRPNQISCSSPRRLLTVDVDVARRSCNAEAPSSVLSSLITWRRVIILEKEVTEAAVARTVSHSKWKSRTRPIVEGATMMHAPNTFSVGRRRIVVGKLVSDATTHISTPSLV